MSPFIDLVWLGYSECSYKPLLEVRWELLLVTGGYCAVVAWAGWCCQPWYPSSSSFSAGHTAHAWPRTVQSVLGHTPDRSHTSPQWHSQHQQEQQAELYQELHYPHYLNCVWCDVVVVWCAPGHIVRCSPLLGATLALADVNTGQLAWLPVSQLHHD